MHGYRGPMSARELTEWKAFFKYRHRKQVEAIEKAKRKR